MEIVRGAPGPAVVGILPAAVHGQQGEVVTGGMVELAPGPVGLDAVVTGPQKHIGHGDHGDDDDDVARAAEAERLEEGPGEQRVHGEAGHGPARWGDVAPRGNGPQDVQLVQGSEQSLPGWRVHEGEVHHVGHAEGLEHERGGGQVVAEDLGHGGGAHVVVVGPPGVQPVAHPGPRTARPARPLVRLGSRHGLHGQPVHAQPRVVRVHLDEPGVHHVQDPVDRDRRLRDVRGHHDLPLAPGCRLEYPRLHLRRHRTVHGEHKQLTDAPVSVSQDGHFLHYRLAARLDLLAARQEHQDVARRVVHVDLHHGVDRGRHVVRLRLP